MIKVYPYHELGQHNVDWLEARYHFSFSSYHNPERMSFGALRVINDDTVKAGSGFAPHGHEDMEIITYVRRGAITHEDNLGNKGRTGAGDVQVMSAGTGITHSEVNDEKEDTRLYQIWIYPREKGVTPRWDQRAFPKTPVNDQLPLLVSGREEDQANGALLIHQDATIHGGRIAAGEGVIHDIRYQAYMLVSEGEVEVDGKVLAAGDGAEITDVDSVTIKAVSEAEVLVIDVPA